MVGGLYQKGNKRDTGLYFIWYKISELSGTLTVGTVATKYG